MQKRTRGRNETKITYNTQAEFTTKFKNGQYLQLFKETMAKGKRK